MAPDPISARISYRPKRSPGLMGMEGYFRLLCIALRPRIVLMAQPRQQRLKLRIVPDRLQQRILREPRVTRQADANRLAEPAQSLRRIAELCVRNAQTVRDVMIDRGLLCNARSDL